jgi:formylglycine-generating enzyme required for sulfatase activity
MKFVLCLLAILPGLSPTGFCQTAMDQNAGGGVRKEFTNSLGMKLVNLPGSPVAISIWETRVSDWETYLKHEGETWTHKPIFAQTSQDPVVNVTLPEAMAFCVWLTKQEQSSGQIQAGHTYRLPTKAEWDAAAGITADGNQSNALFPWGDAWPPMRQSGNYYTRRIAGGRDDGFEFTAPVGQFFPARSGCYDLGGNVCEWTNNAEPDGTLVSALRGGSWMYWRRDCLESQYIYAAPVNTRSPGIGFRCVLEDAAEVVRLARDRQSSAAKLLEKPEVDQKEIEEMRRKLMERRKTKEERETTPASPQEAPTTK